MNKRKKTAFPLSLLAACLLGGFATTAAWGLPLVGFPDATPNATLGSPNSGKFIDVTRGLATLGDVGPGQNVFNVSLAVPASLAQFKLSVFDPDIGAQWDRLPVGTPDQIKFELYKDPNLVGSTALADLLGTWDAEAIAAQANDRWCDLGLNPAPAIDCTTTPGGGTLLLPRVDLACPKLPNGNCYYHLVARWKTELNTNESNFFKVAVEGSPFLLAGSTIGFQAFDRDYWAGSPYPPTAYDGTFQFQFFVPAELVALDMFDGDFDHADDTDDFNTPSVACRGTAANYSSQYTPIAAWKNNQDLVAGCSIEQYNTATQLWEEVAFPPFQQAPVTLAQGANWGDPRDDLGATGSYLLVPPSIFWAVSSPPDPLNPAATPWEVVNDDPSGNKEWELFRIAKTGANVPDPDVWVDSIPAGLYTWTIIGADAANNLFIHSKYNLYPNEGPPGCEVSVVKTCRTPSDPVWSSSCVAKTGQAVDYRYQVVNSSEDSMRVSLIDDPLGVIATDATIPAGGSAQFSKQVAAVYQDTQNVVTVTGVTVDAQCIANAVAMVKVEGGGQGCTPGFWRQTKTYKLWEAAGFSPTKPYNEVFGVGYGVPANKAINLGEVVRASGGGYANLGRHSVAALLNAASGGVDYLFSVEDVIARVRAAYASGDLKIIEDTATTFQKQNDLLAPICK